MRRSFVSAFCLLTLLCTTACDGSPGAPDGGDGLFTWGRVIDFLSAGPVQGVDICIKDTDLCAESANDGTFQVDGLNPDEDILVAFDDNRYFPAVGHMNTARTNDNAWNYRLPTDDAIALQGSLAGADEVVRGAGQVFFAAVDHPDPDIQQRVPGLQLRPAEGSEGLGDVVYGNDVNIPDPNLTETSSQGLAVYINVEPGIYFFEVTGHDNCQPHFSFNSTDGGLTYPVHVFPNTLSAVTIVCQ
jgi:hypothetical protein